jgi:hypothetical protein
MTKRLAYGPICLCALLVIGPLWAAVAEGAQPANATDLTDYIARLGGWFHVTDSNSDPTDQIHDPSAEYWVQVSYSVLAPATGSNLTTIKMTEYEQQREDTKGICSTGNVTTDTVMIDLRELQTDKVTITPGTAGSLKVWLVNLVMPGPLIRVVRAITPPTIVGFSAGSTTTGSGTAATCPALRNDQHIRATTQQFDTGTYPIQFAVADEAKYFKMLITSATGNLNPPRSKNGSPY